MSESLKRAVEESARARSERALLNFKKQDKKCKKCGKPLTFEQRRNKFCSHSCCASVSNKLRAPNRSDPHPCKGCGSMVDSYTKFCRNCINNKRFYRKVDSLAEAETDSTRRIILKRLRGDVCEECGLSEWRGIKLTIQLHHIDGNPDNNIEANLILLCPNCHSITPNYGVKNSTAKNTSRNRKRRNLYHTGHFKDE